MHSNTVSACSLADIITTGTARREGSARTCLRSSTPSTSGIMTSVRTRSKVPGGWERSLSMAWRPDSTSVTGERVFCVC